MYQGCYCQRSNFSCGYDQLSDANRKIYKLECDYRTQSNTLDFIGGKYAEQVGSISRLTATVRTQQTKIHELDLRLQTTNGVAIRDLVAELAEEKRKNRAYEEALSINELVISTTQSQLADLRAENSGFKEALVVKELEKLRFEDMNATTMGRLVALKAKYSSYEPMITAMEKSPELGIVIPSKSQKRDCAVCHEKELDLRVKFRCHCVDRVCLACFHRSDVCKVCPICRAEPV